eukprot:554299_1
MSKGSNENTKVADKSSPVKCQKELKLGTDKASPSRKRSVDQMIQINQNEESTKQEQTENEPPKKKHKYNPTPDYIALSKQERAKFESISNVMPECVLIAAMNVMPQVVNI